MGQHIDVTAAVYEAIWIDAMIWNMGQSSDGIKVFCVWDKIPELISFSTHFRFNRNFLLLVSMAASPVHMITTHR
jgi:hypothetical protein